MNKKVYFAPKTEKILGDIKVEVLAGGSNEEGGYMDDSDANRTQFDDDDDFTLDGNINLWDR